MAKEANHLFQATCYFIEIPLSAIFICSSWKIFCNFIPIDSVCLSCRSYTNIDQHDFFLDMNKVEWPLRASWTWNPSRSNLSSSGVHFLRLFNIFVEINLKSWGFSWFFEWRDGVGIGGASMFDRQENSA
jgi:hypothetical protein